MAKLFRKNQLNQVAGRRHIGRRYLRALLQTTCVLSLANTSLILSAQELLAPPALPSIEAIAALPSCQSSDESCCASGKGGVSLVLRATQLLGLKKIPQIEWSAIDSQLPVLATQLPVPSTQKIELPTDQETMLHGVQAPELVATSETPDDKTAEADAEVDSQDSLLTVDLAQSPAEIEVKPADDEPDSLISIASLPELAIESQSPKTDSQSADSLLDIELQSEIGDQLSQTDRGSEMVKHRPSMQLRIAPSPATVRLSDAEDYTTSETDLVHNDAAPKTTALLAETNSRSPELAKPTSPKMVINAMPTVSDLGATKSKPGETENENHAHALPDSKEHKLSERVVGLIEPALPAQFNMNDKVSTGTEQRDSRDLEVPMSKALAMSLDNLTKSKAPIVPERLEPKDAKPTSAVLRPTIQSVSALIETKSEPAMMRPTTPPTIGPHLEVANGEAQSVLLQSTIHNISVEHPEICQVIKNGEKSISLIGLKPGKTRVAIFSTQNQVEIREVTISGTEDDQAARERMAKEMSRAIEKAYRSSSVEVVADDEGLVVQGFAESEGEAKKIIRMIRQSSLMPVVDRLSTYK
jgi:Pilus formation protein N terminal region